MERMIEMTDNVIAYGMYADDGKMMTLRHIKQLLRDGIRDFQERMREERCDPYFSVYELIEEKLGEGFSQSSVRKWENGFTPLFPSIDRLLTLCVLIGDRVTPEAMCRYITEKTLEIGGNEEQG